MFWLLSGEIEWKGLGVEVRRLVRGLLWFWLGGDDDSRDWVGVEKITCIFLYICYFRFWGFFGTFVYIFVSFLRLV